jgi:serine/threonine protein kinase
MSPEEALSARATARLGQTLHGKWHLDRLLGIGGMAAVYAATHRNGARAAVKILHLELSLDSEVRQRFLREGYAANVVGHPGVVRALDDDAVEDGAVFLVMELLEGETLDDRWERLGRRLPVDEVLVVADELLDILAAAHDRGVVHRDLKPENLFVTMTGLKLLDFGIARVREGAATATRTGMTAGTPAFMAPEQALGHTASVGPRSDLWAVGALLFTMLTGRYVHQGESANEIMIKTATQPAPSLATVRDDLPLEVVAVIDRALAFDIAARWETAAEMQDAVRQVREQLGLPGAPLVPPASTLLPASPVRVSARPPAGEGRAPSHDSIRPPGGGRTPSSDPVVPAGAPQAGSESRIFGPSSFSSSTAPPAADAEGSTGGRRMVLPGIALGLVVASALALVAFRSTRNLPATPAVGSAGAGVSAAASEPAPAASSAAPVPVPVVTVTRPPEGRVKVKVKGGECTILIAGEARGTTEKGALEVAAPVGEQVVRCDLGEGLVLTEISTVKANEVSSVSFTNPRSLPRASAAPAATPAAPATVDPMDRRR